MTTKSDALKEIKLILNERYREIEEEENKAKIEKIHRYAKYYTEGGYEKEVADSEKTLEEIEKSNVENRLKIWKRYKQIVKLGVRKGKNVVDNYLSKYGANFITLSWTASGFFMEYFDTHRISRSAYANIGGKTLFTEEIVAPKPLDDPSLSYDKLTNDVYKLGQIIGLVFFSIDSPLFVECLGNSDFVKKYVNIVTSLKNEFSAFKPAYVRNRLIKRGKKIAKDLNKEQIKGLNYLIDELAKI